MGLRKWIHVMSFVVFDIETGPLPLERLKEIHPGFDRSSIKHPGEFDPSSVKCGNIGGPTSEKGLAKIAEARAAHEKEVASFQSSIEQAEATYWLGIESRAALSAASGVVLAIGYKSENANVIEHFDEAGEHAMLSRFWTKFEQLRKQDRQLVGFNSREFDVPFLAQRSIVNVIRPPRTLLQNDRYLDKTFVDLRDKWSFGSKPAGSLDLICKACGLPGKPDGVSGAHFSELYRNPETRQEALDYLANDLEITFQLAEMLIG
jgi:uncharacterized protein YprB with RNaseH-like and TPR domain